MTIWERIRGGLVPATGEPVAADGPAVSGRPRTFPPASWGWLLPLLNRVRGSWGLRGTLLALYVASAAVIMSGTALLYARSLSDNVRQQYLEHAMSIWRGFDATYASAEDLRGPLVQERLDRFKEANLDIYAIHIYAPLDQRFMAVASSNQGRVGQTAGIDDLEPLLQDRPVWREYTDRGVKVATLGAPLHAGGRSVGVVAVDFLLEPRDALIWQQLLLFFGIAVAGGVVLLAALYWELDRLVLKPLFTLRAQAAAIAAGDFRARAGITRRDEVGELARAFDAMAVDLEDREGENLRLQGELRARYEEAEQRAVRDPITGLYNHGHFYERLRQELARARLFDQPLAVLFCDMDRFQAINDVRGHQAGDRVLEHVAGVLEANISEIDIAARYSGNAFTVILPNSGPDKALMVAEGVRAAIATRTVDLGAAGERAGEAPPARGRPGHGNPAELQRSALSLTASIGIACYPDDAPVEAELVRCAEQALRHAKQLGRNQVCLYHEVRNLVEAEPGGGIDSALYFESVQSLAAAVDARDRYTHRHSDTVSRYATALARALGIDGQLLMRIAVAALLHDVGKIGIPDQILGKTGPLTDDEWEKMREHPVVGKGIVEHMHAHEDVVPLIVHHHERWDGSGYPEGLAGDRIPLGARIIAVADAYHAMTSDRPYRQALSRDTALDALRHEAGKQFDPRIVEAFLQIPEEVLEPRGAGAGRGET